MQSKGLGLRVAGIVAIALTGGCQVIAGVEHRDVDPLLGGCTLPTTGDAQMRFANLVPADASVDVCVKPSGAASFGRPILRGGGTACPAGVSYAQVTAPFAVPSGKVDVKVVPSGSTCSANALSQATITVSATQSTTVVRMGNEKLGEQLAGFGDATGKAADGNLKFRFVHASPGTGALNVGLTDASRLPADLKTPLIQQPIAYGQGTNTQTKVFGGKTDPDGYLELPGSQVNVAIAPDGQARAVALANLPAASGPRSIFALGDESKPYFPVRALVCNDAELSGPLLTKCALSALGTLSIDTFNAYQYGSFAQDEALRKPYELDALASRDADLICITALSRKADQQALIAKAQAKGLFMYSITKDTNLDTQPTNPATQAGTVPPAPTYAACAGTNDPTAVDSAMACLQSKCSTTGTPDGQLKGGSSCISSSCASDFLPLLAGDHDHQRCFGCLTISQLADETHASTRNICTTETRDYKAFNGATTSMVLSRYPLQNVDTYILPSTGYQRVVHYAQVAIEKDKTVDFFCAELSAAFGDLLPNWGPYAPDPMQDRWFQEQDLQGQRVIEYVKSKVGSRPAIITGDWATSEGYTSPDGKIKIDDVNGAGVLGVLDKTFVPALPPGFVPHCTGCATPENLYGGDNNLWQFHTYLVNMPASSAVDAGLFFTDNVVPLPSGSKGPLSDRWGFEVRVLRP